jgi:hypothetical protein
MRHIGVQEGRRFLGLLQERPQLFLAPFQPNHLLVETFGSAALENEIEQRVQLPVDLLDLGFGRIDRRVSVCQG